MLSHCYSVISFMIELTFDVQVDRKNNFRDVLPISQSLSLVLKIDTCVGN